MKLGDTVKDTVSGLTGVAVGRTEWLNGCIRLVVQPPVGNDGNLPDSHSFDIQQLELVAEKPSAKTKPTGGPAPEPTYYPNPV